MFTFSVVKPGQNYQKAHLQAKTFYKSLFPRLYDHPLQRNRLEKLMFRKTTIFGHFWPNSTISDGQNCQKAHLQAKTFHMSLFPGLYDHRLQRYSLEEIDDGRTHGHPESIGPQPWGSGPKSVSN